IRISTADNRYMSNAMSLLVGIILLAPLAIFAINHLILPEPAVENNDQVVPSTAPLLIKPKALAALPFSSEATGHFESAVPGLVGWMVDSEEMGKNIIYATPDGEYTLIGMVVDSQGKNITEEEMIEHLDLQFEEEVTMHPRENGESNYAEQLSFVQQHTLDGLRVEGTTGKTLWVVIDMNCPFCHDLIKEIDKVVAKEEHHHNVEFVPACVLGLESCAMEGLLNATPLEERLVALKNHVNGQSGSFSQVSNEKLEELTEKSFLRAQTFMREEVHAVPSLFWEDESGAVRNHMGLPNAGVVRMLLTGGVNG